MRPILSAAAGVAASLVLTTSAQAQQVPWSGAYIGLNGGYGWGKSTQRSTPTTPPALDADPVFTDGDYNVSGGIAGGTIGYNWQFSNTVLGLESDYAWAGFGGSTICGGGVRNVVLISIH